MKKDDIKLISKGIWFDKGTEVFSTRPEKYNELKRFTLDELNEWNSSILVRGYKNGILDEELCDKCEFEIIIEN